MNSEPENKNKNKFTFDIPPLKPCIIKDSDFKDLTSFRYRSSTKTKYPAVLHFFIDDHRFNSIYTQRKAFLSYLYERPSIQYILSPDYSIYLSDPRSLQIMNCYKKAEISKYIQNNNYKLIPSLSWGDELSYSYAFEGIPEKSCYGIPFRNYDKQNRRFWEGLFFFINKFNPLLLLIFCAPSNQNDFHKQFQFFSEKTKLKTNYIFLNL